LGCFKRIPRQRERQPDERGGKEERDWRQRTEGIVEKEQQFLRARVALFRRVINARVLYRQNGGADC
jgi:hypothetical protein